MSQPTVQTSILRVRASGIDVLLPDLVNVFRDTVNSGSPLGFLAPITTALAHDQWVSILPELEAGSRILLVAHGEKGVMGSGQLVLSQRPNSPHRAEIQKLFVARSARGQGIGKSLMHALHEVALEHGRTLILLNTRHGQPAEEFYKSLGYQVAGVIPGWTIGAGGERYDHVQMYINLGES